MTSEKYTKEEHKQVASRMPRDSEGHFIKKTPQPSQSIPSSAQSPLDKILNTPSFSHKDDLVDLHIGNPLRKITQLLEDLKKQKAFSFSIKGSLGLMGVFLALSVFGILGGGKLLCDRGIQTQIGVIKTLQVKDETKTSLFSQIPLISQFAPTSKALQNRMVLIKKDDTAIRLIFSNSYTPLITTLPVIITGNYDSCSRTLTAKDQKSLEYYR